MSPAEGPRPPGVQVEPGAYLDPEVEVLGPVQIGRGAVVLGRQEGETAHTVLHPGVTIGANATIVGGVVVGMGARVKAGAVVDRSVPPLAIVEGNPARIVAYVDTVEARGPVASEVRRSAPAPPSSLVRGVRLYPFRVVRDLRGSLTATEFGRDIPFQPARSFIVFDVPTAETRGEHAHHRCAQLLTAVKGSVSVVVDDGVHREEFLLDRPEMGLYIPPMVWAIQYRYSVDAALLVMASDPYDPADYIRDYEQFLLLARQATDPGPA